MTIAYKTAATATRYAASWKIGIHSRVVGERVLFRYELIDSDNLIAARSNLDYYSRADAIAAAKCCARLGNV